MIRSLFTRFLHILAFIGPGGGSLRPSLHRLRGAHIGKNVWISHFVYIDDCHADGMHLYWGPLRPEHKGKVVIERDVFIGPHCVILPNVRIGEGAVIKAGTLVSRNVPPHTLWGPPPAEVLAEASVPLTAEHSYLKFMRGMRPAHEDKHEAEEQLHQVR
jgi:acetyltransferase-like isoleucine patch superfamily enzyme